MKQPHTNDDLFLEDNNMSVELELIWKEIEGEFYSSKMVAPEPGFVSRWKTRLLEERKRANRKQAWLIIGIGWSCALILMVLLLLRIIPEMPSVQAVWQNWLNDVLHTFTFIKVFLGIFIPFIRSFGKLFSNDMVWRAGLSSTVVLLMVVFNIRRMVVTRGELR